MTRVVVGEFLKGERNPKVIGLGESETRGVRHGHIVDQTLASQSVQRAVEAAEKTSGIKIKRAFISVSGTSLRGEFGTGMVIVSKADGEVTNLDIEKAQEEAEGNLNLNNKKVIQSFPVLFRLDGKEIQGRIEGMHGTKLEVRSLFLTYSMQQLEDLIEVMARAEIETIDVIGSPIAVSSITLSEKQKIAGVGLVNIGSETVSLTVFENGLPAAMHTFSIGSSDITNDLALGFKINLEKAESLKRGENEDGFSKKKLDEIIEARLSDIFELIENHLKKIKRNELLPAGIVFSGGGANISGIEELSRSILKLPASLASTELFGNTKTKLRDLSYLTALGLIVSGKDENTYGDSSFNHLWRDIKNAIKAGVKQLMP